MRKVLNLGVRSTFKKATAVLSIAALCSTMSIATVVTNDVKVDAAPTANSTLVWSDEFNGNSLDTSKWSAEIGNGASGWGNNELQYYTDRSDNLAVRDGALVITAKREGYGGYNYTSARIKTQDKFYFKYGYVEARMALPSGSGIWPAFWMLGQDIGAVGWPRCGEIDIMEAINAENRVYGTCHWDNGGHANYGTNSGNFDITQYHTYALQWDDQYIRTFVDGQKYYEIYIGGNAGGTEELHNSYFLLFNVAVGGNWPGFNIDNNMFPKTMKVDYVRVYQDNVNFTSTSGSPVDRNNGSNSNTSNNTSNNTASGDIYIYQDSNYGGRSASLGLGDYTLSSLQAKGFYNDDLSSVKVPWGYKVTLFEHDNFTGASRVITGDTNWMASDWNDKVSSIKVEKARYKIINRHSGLALDVNGANTARGTNVQQWGDNGSTAQIWEVSFNHDDSTYVVTNARSGKALDVEDWSTVNGGNVLMWDNNNTNNQRWYITAIDNGYSFLINKHSNLSLEVDAWSTAQGWNVQQWQYYANPNQQWQFIMVN